MTYTLPGSYGIILLSGIYITEDIYTICGIYQKSRLCLIICCVRCAVRSAVSRTDVYYVTETVSVKTIKEEEGKSLLIIIN